MTPEVLAERLRVDRSTLSRIETNKTRPTLTTFNALIRVLPISADELLLAMGYDITPAGIAARIPRSLQNALLELAPDELAQVERLARGIAATRDPQDRTRGR